MKLYCRKCKKKVGVIEKWGGTICENCRTISAYPIEKKTYIQELFDNINGGDCVDSAALAQEICEELLAACKRLIAFPYSKLDRKISAVIKQAQKAVKKAEGESVRAK